MPWRYAQGHPEYMEALKKRFEKAVQEHDSLACKHINTHDGSCMLPGPCDEKDEREEKECGIKCRECYCNDPKSCSKWESTTLEEFAFNANLQPEELGISNEESQQRI